MVFGAILKLFQVNILFSQSIQKLHNSLWKQTVYSTSIYDRIRTTMDAPFESSVAHVQCCISDRCLMFKSMDVNKYIGGETLIFHFAEMLTIEPGFISCGLNIL